MKQIKEAKIWTGPFVVALISNFFLFIIYYALVAIIPVYILGQLNGNEGQAGLSLTLFMLSAIIMRPFSGKIIEVFGKRRTLIISQLFFCLSSILYIFIDSLFLLQTLRFFHGIWFSLATTVFVVIVNDIIPESRKGTGLGYFGMAMNLGVVVGPLIGLTISQWFSYQALFISLSMMAVTGLFSVFILKVSENQPQSSTTARHRRFSWRDFIETKAMPIAIISFLTAFAYASILSFISVYAETKGLFQYISLFFIVYAAAMLSVRPFTGRLYDRKGPSAVIYPSLILFAAGLFLLSNMNSVLTLLLSGVLVGIGYGSLFPCFQALAIQSAEKHRSGHATSTFFILFDSGIALGAFVLGSVLTQWGYFTLYMLGAIIIILTIFVYWKIIGSKREVSFSKSLYSQRQQQRIDQSHH